MHAATARSASADLDGHLARLVTEATGERPLGVGLRRLAPSAVDARVFLRQAPAAAERETLLALLAADPAIASAQVRGREVRLRLSEAHVAELAAELEVPARLPDAGPLAGRSFVVNFLNPNATKPLHVGHLRNVTLGHALAATLEAAGARVERQCYVCDIGRNVCEALAGWELLHGRRTPQESGLAPDVFVGRCYSDYAATAAAGGEHDPIGAEARTGADPADERIRAWLAGDEAVLSAWRELRDWALSGQARTLARLGVAFDRVRHESDGVATARRLAQRGLELGVLRREVDGAIVFPTGRADYASLPLIRGDGFPTEHARVIALFVDEQAERESCERWIVVCGDEWGAAGAAELDVASKLAPCPLAERVQVVAHGMVTLEGSKMKSRDGRALLADELLDALEAEPSVRALAEQSAGAVEPAEVAQLLARGFFLSRRPAKSIELEWQAFLDPLANPAWALARAWSRPLPDAPTATDPELPRAAILQLHQLRQLLAGAADDFRPTEITKLANAIAAWSLDQPPSRDLHRAVRAILSRALFALGLGWIPLRS